MDSMETSHPFWMSASSVPQQYYSNLQNVLPLLYNVKCHGAWEIRKESQGEACNSCEDKSGQICK